MRLRYPRLHLTLIAACAAGLGPPAAAFTEAADTVVVTGHSQGTVVDAARPTRVLDREALAENVGDSLGTLLEGVPGLANAAFGPGVGRPVIRGLGGSRVRVLVNGLDAADTSAMSSDHAPMAELTGAERVEILYGPATLLYGGGAIGGVVNVVDDRIAETPGQTFSAELGGRATSNDRARTLDARLGAGHGPWTWRLDGFLRETDDYESGRRGRVPEGFARGRIANSDTRAEGASAALSWADAERGFVGGSLSLLNYDYGVPNLDGATFRVVPEQIRADLRGAWRPDAQGPLGWIREWRTEGFYNDYFHAETGEEFDIPGAPIVDVGLFDQQTFELTSRIEHRLMAAGIGYLGLHLRDQRLALCHDHGGCPGIPSFAGEPWDGERGFNLENRERGGFLLSHDTPMPRTRTRQAGLFVVQELPWRFGLIDLGARVDHIELRADPDPIDPNWRQPRAYYDTRRYTPTTVSAAATRVLREGERLALALGRVQRAPEAPELFWNGDHHATFAFQLDNPDLTVETALTADLNWLRESHWGSAYLGVFHYAFDGFIYNDLKDFRDPFHGNPVYRHEQRDARFTGAEASLTHEFRPGWKLITGADVVRARLEGGENVPRTPPASLLLTLAHERGATHAHVSARWVGEQNRTAPNESESPGHVLLGAALRHSLTLPQGELELRLAADNLLDAYAVNHVSFLKEAAPLPGRNLRLGLRWRF